MTERQPEHDATTAPQTGDVDQRQALTDDLANPGQLDSTTGGYGRDSDDPGESGGPDDGDHGPGGDMDTGSIA